MQSLRAPSLVSTGVRARSLAFRCTGCTQRQPTTVRSAVQERECVATSGVQVKSTLFAATSALAMALAQSPALADAGSLSPTNPFDGMTANSLYVTLGLFLMSVPGAQGLNQGTRGRRCHAPHSQASHTHLLAPWLVSAG